MKVIELLLKGGKCFTWNKFRITLILLCILRSTFGNEIFEADGRVFIKHQGILVKVFQRDHFQSKTFVFGSNSFHIPKPQSITTLNSTNVRIEAEQFADNLIHASNRFITSSYDDICSSKFEREKRFMPVIVIGGSVLLFGLIMFIRNEIQFHNLQKELAETRAQLNDVTVALNNMSQSLIESQHLSKLKFDLMNYVKTSEHAIVEFIKLLKSGKAVKLEELPDVLAQHFSIDKQNVKEKFYSLRLIKCSGTKIHIEVTVASAVAVQELECNSFSHLGSFNDNIFLKYELPNLYCYTNETCSIVDIKQCISDYNNFNCTEAAFYKCNCEVNAIEKCQVKAQLAADNFINVIRSGNIVSVATTSKFYDLIHHNSKVTQAVPPSGIFSVILNENDKIAVAGAIIEGEADEATFIAHIMEDKFTVAPVPQAPTISTNYKYTANYIEKYAFEACIVFVAIVLICCFCMWWWCKR